MLGCLPMLLPMPVLFALYFVFQNTIEFRGVSFLWLPDISLRDPYYIMPIVMGASMFLLSWIGMRASAAESAGEDDELHDAGDVHVHVPQLRVGAESLLRRAEHRRAAAAMDRDSGASKAGVSTPSATTGGRAVAAAKPGGRGGRTRKT